MPDVFISYARDDIERVRVLYYRLLAEGWDVYIDLQTHCGTDALEHIRAKLAETRCVVVVWSRHSIQSNFVREESETALSRGRLAACMIDLLQPERELPLGFRSIQVEDLSAWSPDRHVPGMSKLIARIYSICDRPAPRGAPPPTITKAMVSVSDLDEDRDAILHSLVTNSPAHHAVEAGYHWLDMAHRTAIYEVNDHAPLLAYGAAAENFTEALNLLDQEAENQIVREGKPVRYFLNLEIANALAFSCPDTKRILSKDESERGNSADDSIRMSQDYWRAISIYKGLNNEFPNDPAVHLRLGQAYARTRHDQSRLQDAIVHLERALHLCGGDSYVLKGQHWTFQLRAPILIGRSHWRLADLPGVKIEDKRRLIEQAIAVTRPLIRQPKEDDHDKIVDQLHQACSNTLYFLAKKAAVDGRLSADVQREIEDCLALVFTEPLFTYARRQVRSVDNILYAAMAVQRWDIIGQMARANLDALENVIDKRRRVERAASGASDFSLLDELEIEMLVRAREMAFVAAMRGA